MLRRSAVVGVDFSCFPKAVVRLARYVTLVVLPRQAKAFARKGDVPGLGERPRSADRSQAVGLPYATQIPGCGEKTMGLFDKIKRLFGNRPSDSARRRAWCPHCGAKYAWDGRSCERCGFVGPAVNPPQSPTAPPLAQPIGRSSAPPQAQSIEGLDTDKFRPLTVEQATEMVDQTASFRSAFLDPLNVIPDENLPRIQVINRTMIGLGLISAEDLARIHEVGKEMDELRGTERGFARAGEAAVQRSRQERERIRAQKKKEAEDRRERRAQEINERRRTDIVFLGRGVSKGLSDRRSNVEKLEANGLPILSTPADVAEALGLNIPRLRWLAFHSEASRSSHYIRFTVPKKSGGLRQIATPHRTLAKAQYWILENIVGKLPVHDAAHGFVPGRSTVTNATPHVGAFVVVNTDLSDFFPSINVFRVLGVFRSMGYSPAVATMLALLCTESPRREVSYAGETYHAAVGPRALPQGGVYQPGAVELDCSKTGRAAQRYRTETKLEIHTVCGRYDVLRPSRTCRENRLRAGARSPHL